VAEGLEVGPVPYGPAFVYVLDVVDIGCYLAAIVCGAKWLIEQDAAAQQLPSLAVIDVAVAVGFGVALFGVALAAATVGGRVGAAGF
jgi:hypothetical protein